METVTYWAEIRPGQVEVGYEEADERDSHGFPGGVVAMAAEGAEMLQEWGCPELVAERIVLAALLSGRRSSEVVTWPGDNHLDGDHERWSATPLGRAVNERMKGG